MNLANKAIQVISKLSEDQGDSMLYIIIIIDKYGPDLYFNVLALSLKTALGDELLLGEDRNNFLFRN